MFQRFEGETITADLHQIGPTVHLITTNTASQELSHTLHTLDSEDDAKRHFDSTYKAFEFLGFLPVDTDF